MMEIVSTPTDPDPKTFGSSVSDFDHAQFNVVMQNQIVKRSFLDMIKVGTPVVVGPRFFTDSESVPHQRAQCHRSNVTVRTELRRGAGCYLSDGYPNFIQDGQFTNVFHKPTGDRCVAGTA